MIWIHGEEVQIDGEVYSLGGAPGLVDASVGLASYGGEGADGRIRIDGLSVILNGTADPVPYSDGSAPDCSQ